MNDAKPNDQLQPLYPPYVNAQYVEDEINLVDIWIAFSRYKQLFWGVFFSLLVIGVALALFVFNERYTLTSAVQIGSVYNDGASVAIESPESLKSKLNDALIPGITINWLGENPEFTPFKTTISNAKGSDIILIQHKVKKLQIESFTEIQNLISSAVIDNHQEKIILHQSDLRARLEKEKAKLKELKDRELLELLLDKKKLLIETGVNRLARLEANYQLTLKGGADGLLKSLSSTELEALMTRDGIVIDQLLNLRYEKFLLNNKVSQDEQKRKNENERINLLEIKKNHEIKIINKELVVKQIGDKIKSYDITRLISAPVASLEPAGLSRKLLLVLVIFLAGFAGFVFTLIAMFRDKVKERLLEVQ